MRIRTIKPEYWTHPVMTRLKEGPRLLGVALLNYADDAGYFFADTDMVRGAVMFREESTTVRRWIDELSRTGYIQIKDHPTHGEIGWIVKFKEHQRIDRAKPSIIAPFWKSAIDRRRIDDLTAEEQGTGNRDQGMEGNGMRDDSKNETYSISEPIPEAWVEPLKAMTKNWIERSKARNPRWRVLQTFLIMWPTELWDFANRLEYSFEDLQELVNWALSNDFWGAVVLSPNDLIKNHDKIVPQMTRKPAGIVSAVGDQSVPGTDEGEGWRHVGEM